MTMAANIAKHISHLDLPNVWQLTEELYMHIQDRYKMHHVCAAHASTPNQFCIVIISCHPKWLHASRALRLDVALKSSNLFFGNLPECLFFHFLFKRCISLWYAFEYNNLRSAGLGPHCLVVCQGFAEHLAVCQGFAEHLAVCQERRTNLRSILRSVKDLRSICRSVNDLRSIWLRSVWPRFQISFSDTTCFVFNSHAITQMPCMCNAAAPTPHRRCVGGRGPTNRRQDLPSSLSPTRTPSAEPPSWFQVTSVESELQNPKRVA